jgi:hypothetical protein
VIEFNGEQIIQWLEKRWERKSTITSLLILIFVALVWKFTDSSLSDLALWESLFILCLLLAVFLLWVKSTSIPKTPRGHVGIAVAITCEGDREKQKIASDFISELRRLLSKEHGGELFYLVEISEYSAKLITDHEVAAKIRLRSHSHIILYGSAKIREVQDVNKHILDLNMQVGHRPIPKQVSQRLAREMAELFPQRLHIDTKNDLLSLGFTSEWINCVAQYIVGITASISGDLKRSEALFLDLSKNNHFQTSSLPHIKKLRQRVPIRLGEIYEYRASTVYELWRKDREIYHIDDMWTHLSNLRRFCPDNYPGLLLSAICYFVRDRNIEAAVRELRKCRNIQDTTWRFSYAFLMAYSGKMNMARHLYHGAFKHFYNRADVPFQTEEFLYWVLEVEPDKIQLLFCLGLLNWYAKGDLQTAINNFEQFLVARGSVNFPEEVRLAQAYIGNLKTEIIKQSEKKV